MIRQGDVFWFDSGEPSGSAPGYLRPYVAIQNNLYNQSRLQTVLVCALTSNLMRSRVPGNVLLDEGEADQIAEQILVAHSLEEMGLR